MKKFCTRCGRQFESVGREVICPSCKAAAEAETKRAAVLRAKKASWTGESVPVRISGRASTVIRRYGAANKLPFAAALDALLQASDFFKSMNVKWEDITPYRSHRRDKSTATSTTETSTTASKPQDVPQEAQEAQEVKQVTGKQDEPVKPVKQAAKKAIKTVKTAGKAGKGGKA